MPEKATIQLPVQFITRMQSGLGHRFDEFVQSMNTDSPVAVRLNPAKWIAEKPKEPVDWCDNGYYLPVRPSFTADPWFHGGAYYVQEPSSMFLEQAWNSIPKSEPLAVLDLCGAPGGKTTHLLSLLRPNDFLVANEVIRSRAIILQENVQKWGYPNVVVTANDPRDFATMKALFDIVVIDAPCSGEGLFRKDRRAIEEWSVENTSLCTARQKRIMAEAWQCLKPGGHLIYSTCTYNPDENEHNLHWLASQENAGSVKINLKPEWNVTEINYKTITGYQFFPHLTKGEGFFTGILQKPGETVKPGKSKILLKNFKPASKSVLPFVESWIKPDKNFSFYSNYDGILVFPVEWEWFLYIIEKKLNIFQAGTSIATGKNNQFIPHPALANSMVCNRSSFPFTPLGLDESIRFLRRDNLYRNFGEKGWHLAGYRDIPLGWLKMLDNRSNNYFPKERRIRMMINEIPQLWHESMHETTG